MVDKKIVIILSQGRSGSTLIQRLLHCLIDDSSFTGENNNFWYHIYHSYRSWKTIDSMRQIDPKNPDGSLVEYTKSDNYKPCWYNFYKPDDLLQQYRDLFFKLHDKTNSRVVGFKEIRFPLLRSEFNSYINFFRLLFPDAKFIFSYRDIDSVIGSGWWKPYHKHKLLTIQNLLEDYYSSNKDYTFLINYKNLTSKDYIKNMFSFIGENFNESGYEKIISNKYR